MKIETMATIIAREANKCCDRSDGYEESIKALAEDYLIETWNAAIEEAANHIDSIATHGIDIPKEIRKLKK